MGLTELLHSGQAGIGRAEGAQISGGGRREAMVRNRLPN
jgi:hypothetical protein